MIRALWIGAALASAGCDAGVAHPFGAYRYDPVGDCLEAPGVVDVLEGPAPAACDELRCFEAPSGAIFVTDKACEAPPDFVERTADSSGSCVKALCAYHATGHGRCPREDPDAGSGGCADGGS